MIDEDESGAELGRFEPEFGVESGARVPRIGDKVLVRMVVTDVVGEHVSGHPVSRPYRGGTCLLSDIVWPDAPANAADVLSQFIADIAAELGCAHDNEAILKAIDSLKVKADRTQIEMGPVEIHVPAMTEAQLAEARKMAASSSP